MYHHSLITFVLHYNQIRLELYHATIVLISSHVYCMPLLNYIVRHTCSAEIKVLASDICGVNYQAQLKYHREQENANYIYYCTQCSCTVI